MEQENTLGKRIAMLRRNQGWTQEQLGEKVGVSAQAVSKWENDQACPDITTLPLLADLFGVTTDELLGLKPIEPHVVILDKEPEENKEKKQNLHYEFNFEAGSWASITTCITAILICVMLIVRSTTSLFNAPDVATWNYIWPLLVFGIGLYWVKSSIIFGITMMAVGVYEFIWFGWGVPFEIKWYVIVLILAIAYLIRTLLKKLGLLSSKKGTPFIEVNGRQPVRDVNFDGDTHTMKAELAFGSNEIVYPDDTLAGMEIETSFGDHRIDLRNVQNFVNDPVLKIEVAFGNVVILLPDTVRIHKASEMAFGAVRIKGEPDVDATQIAYVRSEVSFGNLEICYPDA